MPSGLGSRAAASPTAPAASHAASTPERPLRRRAALSSAAERTTVDELFDAWERAWSGRDPAAFEPLCDPDVHYEDPLTPEPLEGAAAIVGHARRLWASFPDARLQATGDRLHDGRYAAAPCKLLATHREDIEGLSATNRFIIVHAIVYAELRDGRLLRVRAIYDLYGAAVQLGVLPKPGTLGEKALLMLRGFGLRT